MLDGLSRFGTFNATDTCNTENPDPSAEVDVEGQSSVDDGLEKTEKSVNAKPAKTTTSKKDGPLDTTTPPPYRGPHPKPNGLKNGDGA